MTADFPPEIGELWKLYTQVYSSFNSHLDRVLRQEAAMRFNDYRILTVLADAGGSAAGQGVNTVRMGRLAAELNASPSRLTYQVDRLIQRGWLERTAVEKDRRGKVVFITERGYTAYRDAAQVHRRELHEILSTRISRYEAEILASVIQRILRGIESRKG